MISSSSAARTLGLLGGMSWESSAHYYRRLNELIRRRLGARHSAPLILWSADFEIISELQHADNWESLGEILAGAAQGLESSGAEALLICANTMHRVAGPVQAAVSIPLLHLAGVTAEAVRAAGFRRIGLLGTRFTMEADFYRDRLRAAGLAVTVPDAATRAEIHRIIFAELVQGRREASSRRRLLEEIERLHEQGAEAVILGCTEFGLLVAQNDTVVPLFDTTELHCRAAVRWMLGG